MDLILIVSGIGRMLLDHEPPSPTEVRSDADHLAATRHWRSDRGRQQPQWATLPELATRDRLVRLERALEDRYTVPGAMSRRRLVAAQVAGSCDALLAPGLLPDAPRVAQALLSIALHRSGYAWELDGLSTVMQLRAWARRPGPLEALADWAAIQLSVPARRARRDWLDVARRRSPDVPLARKWVSDHTGDPRFPPSTSRARGRTWNLARRRRLSSLATKSLRALIWRSSGFPQLMPGAPAAPKLVARRWPGRCSAER